MTDLGWPMWRHRHESIPSFPLQTLETVPHLILLIIIRKQNLIKIFG